MKRKVTYTEYVCDICEEAIKGDESEEKLITLYLPGKKITFESYVPFWVGKEITPVRAEVCPKCARRIYDILAKEMRIEGRGPQGTVVNFEDSNEEGEYYILL